MSTPEDEQIRRMGAMYEGDHLSALERLELICGHATPGQGADMTRMLSASATQAGRALQKLSHELDPPPATPGRTPPKGTLPSPA